MRQGKLIFCPKNLAIFGICSIALLAIIYSIACHISSQDIIGHAIYSNADFLFAPYFAHNIIYQHGHFSDWSFPNAPYFFPDILILYLTSLLFKNIFINFLIYGLFQIIFFVIIFGLLFKSITKTAYGFRLGILTAFICLFLFAKSGIHVFYFDNFLIPNDHFASLLMTFTALWLLVLLLRNMKLSTSMILFLLVVITSVSDPLMTYYFAVPAIFTLVSNIFINLFDKKNTIKLTFLLFISALSSYYLYRHLPLPYFRGTPTIDFHFYYISKLYHTLIDDFFSKNIFVSTIWLGFLILAPFSIVFQFKNRKQKKDNLVNFIILFEFITIFWGIFAALFIHNGYGFIVTRYLFPFIYGPAFLGFPFLVYKHIDSIRFLETPFVYLSLLLLLIMTVLLNNPPLEIQNLLNYYPPYLSCLDMNAKKFHLHAGVSGYWQAKTSTVYNHSGIRVAAVIPINMLPYHWNNTLQVYRKNDFDFVMIDDSTTATFKRSDLLRQFGKPTHIFSCDHYSFYTYNHGQMKGIFPAAILKQQTHIH